LGAFSLRGIYRHGLSQGRFVWMNAQSGTFGQMQMTIDVSWTTAICDING
jgi:hypothetical protein